jgi:hypothetical protein
MTNDQDHAPHARDFHRQGNPKTEKISGTQHLPEAYSVDVNLRNIFIGCAGIIALFAVIGIGGAIWAWTQLGPSLSAYMALPTEIARAVPGASETTFNINTMNGRNTVRVRCRVPFDVSNKALTERAASKIVAVIKKTTPTNFPVPSLELRMFGSDEKGGQFERIFNYDLTKPLPEIKVEPRKI